MPIRQDKAPLPLVAWLLFCAFCTGAGWILSWLHALDAAGYSAAFALGLAVVLLLWRCVRVHLADWRLWQRRRRFRRLFPLAFLVLTVMAVLGGILYSPVNYDGLAYRTPRLLHWLAAGRWHWIHTEFTRLNTRAPGFEWVSAPFIVFTRTDRLLFLINAASFLLLPGLIFSLFTRLGIRRRVAWHWMWLLPTGYCFVLQAGGIGNDLFASLFGIAALDFALRARRSHRCRDLWLSILAAALMTGSKANTLPLLLPWAIAILPSTRLLWRRPFALLTGGAAVLLVSLAPMVLINLKHTGDWSGLAAEQGRRVDSGSIVHVANNAVLLTIQNLAPPVFPLAGAWNRLVARDTPTWLRSRLERSFEPAGAHWQLGEMQIEEDAGIGFGVSLLLVVDFLYSAFGKGFRTGPPRVSFSGDRWSVLIIASTFIAVLALMFRSGLADAARVTAPYYVMMASALLALRGQGRLVRANWWRSLAVLVFAMAGLLLVLSPSRPLWPANYILGKLDSTGHPLLARAKAVYSIYSERADSFAPARRLIPAGVRVLGVVTADDPETSLWRPFGHWRVEHVTHTDSARDLRQRGICYVLADEQDLATYFHCTVKQWVRRIHGKVLAEVTLLLRVTEGPSRWYLVKLGAEDHS